MELVNTIKPTPRFLMISVVILFFLCLASCGHIETSDLPKDAEDTPPVEPIKIDSIEFTDPALKKCVTSSDNTYAFEVKTLICNSVGITDLSGIENLVELNHLELYNNQIESIDELAHLEKLNYLQLNISDNDASTDAKIADIIPLSYLTELTYLSMRNHAIVNISPLSSLSKLATLKLKGNNINDINPLASLSKLTFLDLESNDDIVDISALSQLQYLSYLYLTDNAVTDVLPLATIQNLQHLLIEDNNIEDICLLQNMESLQTIHLQNNDVSGDVSCLSNLKEKNPEVKYSINFEGGNERITCQSICKLEKIFNDASNDQIVRPNHCVDVTCDI